MPQVDTEDEELEFKNRRDQVINTIVMKYRDHPFVVHAIYDQKKEQSGSIKKFNDLSVNEFLAEAGTFKLLTREDEQRLFGKIDAGYSLYEELDDMSNLTPEQESVFIDLVAAHQIIYHTNFRLAFSIAKTYLNFNSAGLEAMDHVQESLVGLSTAITRFDVSQGFKFSTYATTWITQNVRREIANKSRTVRLPVHMHDKYLKTIKAVKKVAYQLNRSLTHDEIANATGMDYEKYAELMRVGYVHIHSLESILPNNDSELGDMVGYDHMNQAIANFSDNEELAKIIDTARLSSKEKIVIGLRFGLEPELLDNPSIEVDGRTITYADIAASMQTTDGLTLQEMGDAIGLTRERIRQIQAKVIRSLQVSARKQKGVRVI